MNSRRHTKVTLAWFMAIAIFLSLFYYQVWNFFIAGDDIFHLVRAPNNLREALTFFTHIQQYRPIPHNFFAIYKVLPWSVPLFHFVSIALFSAVLTTFAQWLKKTWKLSTLAILLAVITVATHHVSFYLIYTLSGVGDLLFLQFFWLSILSYEYFLQSDQSSLKKPWLSKHFILSWVFFILTIFTKEIFISLPVFIIVRSLLFSKTRIRDLLNITELTSKLKQYAVTFTTFLIPTALFYFIKLWQYQATESAYSYHFSLSTLLENTKHFLLWVISYQHGWQMGMPVLLGPWYKGLIIIWLLLLITSSVYLAYYQPKRLLLSLGLIIASLLPFIFLQRVLVFYLDVALFAVAFIYASTFELWQQKYRSLFWLPVLTFIITSQLLISKTIESQWLTYSFVARSVVTAQNFKQQVINKVDWNSNQQLCISNLSGDASWAIDQGKMATLYTKKDLSIISSDKNLDSEDRCIQSIQVLNQGDTFEILSP